MGRMDKYEEEKEVVLSRTSKNEDLYKDVYLNNTLVDLNKLIVDGEPEEAKEELEIKEEISINEVYYEEHRYNLDEFLREKREKLVNDNLPRSLDEKIKENETEISKLISKIEEKSKNEDFFTELLPDNENTIITNRVEEEKLNNFISDEVIDNFVMNKELDETNSFIDVDDTKQVVNKTTTSKPKVKLKPLIALVTSFVILIIVILYIIFRT